MKILILLSRIDQTGMTTNALDLAKGLITKNNDVYLVTGGQVEKNNTRLDQIFMEFEQIGVKIKLFKTPEGSKIKQKLTSVLSLVKILYTILSINPQVIHAQSPYMSFIPWLLGKKFVSTLHVNDFVKTFKYKNATHLIAISKETKEYAMHLFDYKPENITIINHGVSIDFATNMNPSDKIKFKTANKIPIDKIIIGFVGSIEKRKGHDLLLNAIERLDASLKNNIHVVFLGSSKDNRTRPWLDGLIEETKTADLVSCFDYQNPKPFYKIFDIFVLPSRLEGFGLVVIEAMLSECCVIRSNTEGAYDQISHGEDGYIFENNNYQELSDQLANVIKDKNFRQILAKKGKAKALKKFTIEEMTKGTLDVYNKVKLY